MKTEPRMLVQYLLCFLLLPGAAGAQQTQEVSAKAEAYATADGSNVERKTVTVISENGRTVRKTTIYRNGKEETTTEILDRDGNVIDGGDQSPSPDEPGSNNRDPEEHEPRPWIGLRVQVAPEALSAQLGLEPGEGAVVDAVAQDGPAADAGVKINDLLLEIDGRKIGSPEDLRGALDACEVGQQVHLGLLRRGREHLATVLLGEQPDGEEMADSGAHPDRDPADVQVEAGGLDGQRTRNPRTKRVEVEVSGDSLKMLDEVLANPNLPEEFKKSVREFQERMRDLEKLHKDR